MKAFAVSYFDNAEDEEYFENNFDLIDCLTNEGEYHYAYRVSALVTLSQKIVEDKEFEEIKNNIYTLIMDNEKVEGKKIGLINYYLHFVEVNEKNNKNIIKYDLTNNKC